MCQIPIIVSKNFNVFEFPDCSRSPLKSCQTLLSWNSSLPEAFKKVSLFPYKPLYIAEQTFSKIRILMNFRTQIVSLRYSKGVSCIINMTQVVNIFHILFAMHQITFCDFSNCPNSDPSLFSCSMRKQVSTGHLCYPCKDPVSVVEHIQYAATDSTSMPCIIFTFSCLSHLSLRGI